MFTLYIWYAATATAKSLQSCPTLCNPIDSSPPGFTIPGTLQAKTPEWVAISFSNAWHWKVKVKSLSSVQLSDPMDWSPPGSSIHGIPQARIRDWVAISFSRGSSQPRDQTQVSRIVGRRFNLWATREARDLGSIPGSGRSPEKENPQSWGALRWLVGKDVAHKSPKEAESMVHSGLGQSMTWDVRNWPPLPRKQRILSREWHLLWFFKNVCSGYCVMNSVWENRGRSMKTS